MNKGAIVLIIIGAIIVFFPQIIAYAIGGLLIIIGILIVLGNSHFGQSSKKNDYFKFGDYKIYKNK